MSSIDSRVVSMKFDNAQFEKGVKTTQNSLKDLNKSLEMKGAGKGLADVGKSISGFSLQNISKGVETISSRFSLMGIAGVAALANIASAAVSAGVALVKSLTIDPITQGLQEYETQLNSVQTILANTQSKGTTITDVNGALKELNTYADMTVYNFSEMARNIGMFTAAGVDLETSTASIKGIANLAALSGSNSQQASTAMYQLSQAISSGTVRLMDWNSVVNAGMGGEVFQEALKRTARAHGVNVDGMIEKNGSFRESLQEGWLSAEIMTETLTQLTGDLNKEQIMSMGYTAEQADEMMALADTAVGAATKVKTLSQLMGTLAEAAGSGWAQTWQIVFGDFEEARTLFTGVSDVLGGMIGKASDARNNLLQGWKDLGGRDALIQAIANAFHALMAILAPVGQAFREIFPPVTAQTLYDLTVKLRDFTATLTLNSAAANSLKSVFRGVFAVFQILGMVLSGVISTVLSFLGLTLKGTGSILTFAGSIGEAVVKFRDFLQNGKYIEKFFTGLSAVLGSVAGVLATVVGAIGAAGKAVFDFFKSGKFELPKIDFSPLASGIDNLKERFHKLQGIIDWVKGKVQELMEALKPKKQEKKAASGPSPIEEFLKKLEGVKEKLGPVLKELKGMLSNVFKDFNINTILDVLNVGFFGLIAIAITRFFSKGKGDKPFKIDFGLADLATGLKDSAKIIGEGLGQVTSALQTMQNAVKAGTILTIAIALGVLAASVLTLSMIDPAKLTTSLTALSVMLGQLMAAMSIVTKITTGKELGEIIALTTAMVILGVALNVMAGAVEKMSGLSWEELARGLTGTVALLAMVVGVSKLMSGQTRGLITASVGIIAIALAIRLLGWSVKSLSEMSWEELAKGLIGTIGLMAGIGLAVKLLPAKSLIGAGVGLLAIAFALKIMGEAVGTFGAIKTDEMVRGISGVAMVLILLTATFRMMPKNTPLLAGSLVGVAYALNEFSTSMTKFATMSWEEIARSLVALGGGLVILAGVLNLMKGALPGAASLVVASAALWVIVPLFIQLGAMDWGGIARATVALAAALALIAAGMYVMTGIIAGAASMLVAVAALWVAVPLFMQLGTMDWGSIAKAAVGLAALLGIIAAGMYLMTGGIAGAAGLVAAAIALGMLVPVLFALGSLSWGQLLMGLAAIGGALAVLGIGGALITPVVPTLFLLGAAIALLGVGAGLAGAGVYLLATGIAALITAIVDGGDQVIQFIMNLLQQIPQIVVIIGNTLAAVLGVIIQNVPLIVEAFVAIVNGILQALQQIVPQMQQTMVDILSGMLQGIITVAPQFWEAFTVVMTNMLSAIRAVAPQIVATIVQLIQLLLNAIQSNIGRFTQSGVNIIVGLLNGIASNMGRIVTAGVNVVTSFLNGIANNIGRVVTAAVNVITSLLNGIASNLGRIITAGTNVVVAFINGISNNVGRIVNAGLDLVVRFMNGIASGIRSRSGEMRSAGLSIGMAIVDGMTGGVMSKAGALKDKAMSVARDAINGVKGLLGIHSPSRVFREIGEWTGEGFIIGIDNKADGVARSAANMGETAMDNIKKSLQSVSALAIADMDMTPTITPVLDLSQVRKDASELSSFLPSSSTAMALQSSYNDAANTASSSLSKANSVETNPIQKTEIQFVQNNNSPVALSNLEIYRQTKNQLAMVAGSHLVAISGSYK